MTVSTPEQRKLRIAYCSMLAEVRLRHNVAVRANAGHFDLPPLATYELCYLQFRMICELIALGCLAVHGDNPKVATTRLQSAHQADFILKALEKLHPSFYPEPGILVTGLPNGAQAFKPEPTPLPKEELVQLYWKCGEILHRGSFKRIEKPPAPHMEEIEPICRKIADLIKFHRIAFLNSTDELWITIAPGKSVNAKLVRPSNLMVRL